jgi:hypothetical protein
VKVYLDSSNFGYFAFRTSSNLLSEKDRTIALALTIFMGIATCGVGHLISSIVYMICRDEMSKLESGSDSAFQKNLQRQIPDHLTLNFYDQSQIDKINRELKPGQIGPIAEISSGLRIASAVASTGEKVYFAMESIEDSDKRKWTFYRQATAFLIHGGDDGRSVGSLLELADCDGNEHKEKEFLSRFPDSSFWSDNKQMFEQLKRQLRERKISSNTPKGKALLTLPQASNGMNVHSQTHVVYASKNPITCRAHFSSSQRNFGKFVDRYSDLIMCVGVTISNIVENRGIFRNPLSIIDGGYGGIAMMMHSFTCMASKQSNPEIATFRVRPLKAMGELFMCSLSKEEITIDGIRGDQYAGGFESERDVRVPVDILANLHCHKVENK